MRGGWAVTSALVCLLAMGGVAEAQSARVEAPAEPPVAEPPVVDAEVYGLLAASAFWNSRPLVNADAPIAVLPGRSASLGATVRQSRIGVRVGSPSSAAALSAEDIAVVVEIDFLGGQFPANDLTYAMPHPRLRLFHAKSEWAGVTLVVGQDWIPFAPRNPVSVAHVAVAGFQGAGNAWSRLPQVKLELAEGVLEATAAVLAPVAAGPVDGAAGPGLSAIRTPGPAERSEAPSLQARVGMALPIGERAWKIGLSSHWGREETRAGMPAQVESVTSWGLAVDADLELLPWLRLQGEALTGANLDGLFVDADLVGDEAVPVVAGWVQLSTRFGAFAAHAGIGVEDPRAPGDQALPDGVIDDNGALYLAVVGHAGPASAGLELSQLWTRRVGSSTVHGTQLALGMLLPF